MGEPVEKSPHVLEYRSLPVNMDLVWERGPDGLLIRLPPPPAWHRSFAIFRRACWLCACALFTLCTLRVALSLWIFGDPALGVRIMIAAMLVGGAIASLDAFRRLKRSRPYGSTTIAVSGGTISVDLFDRGDTQRLNWSRSEILDMRVCHAGLGVLRLRIELQRGDMAELTIRTRAAVAPEDLEGDLRSALGMES